MKRLLKDIIMLTKPGIIRLLAVTCLGGMLVATGGNWHLLTPTLVVSTLLGLALSSGGANCVNMWYDRDIDKVMKRTQNRPLPAGRLQPRTVLVLGIALGLSGHLLLWWQVNTLAAWMASSGFLFYVCVYTLWLKRRTVHNIVIGGAAGAFPPLVGWAAVQGDLNLVAWSLFFIIFLWTPPHFWALALVKNDDYRRAHIPMLPVVAGLHETKLQIVYYLLILIPVTLGLTIFAQFGWIYFTTALVLGGLWLYKAVILMYAPGTTGAMAKFRFSIVYLGLLFAAMVVDTFI